MVDDTSGSWPLTYLECRERFRRAALRAEVTPTAHTIAARGPSGEELNIDVAHLGSRSPRRALLVMSGTHGIEGFAGSTIQTDLLLRLAADPRTWGDTALVLVHAVNPWGMAWWRRANENNVDLNRNWQDFGTTALPQNEPYRTVHPLLCPDGPDLPDGDRFVADLSRLSAERGLDWVRRAISGGQYSHPDGLYFGGHRRQESTQVVEAAVTAAIGGAEAVLSIDLHTGFGPRGTYTLLSREPAGSERDRWLRATFDPDRIEATVQNPQAATATKVGQLAPGLIAAIGPPRNWSVTFELGTRSETRVIVAERAEHWVHRHGRRHTPEHAAAVWEHRICSIPDDAGWEATAVGHGRTVLDQALHALPDL